MTEHSGYDDEERAWALRVARAFLAPPDEASVAGRPSPDDEGPPPAPVVVLAVAVVPLAVPPEARGAEATRRRGDGEQEGEQEGSP